MIVDDRVRQALDLSKLKLPASPKVVRIEAEDYSDWSGEDALLVNVLLDEDVDIDKVTGRDIIALKSAIRDSLLASGVQVFPYTRLYKESELADEADEE